MCNACGNVCCGSDMFGKCGCDGCDEPDCWSDDNDFSDSEEFECCAPSGFICEETTSARLVAP